MEQKPVFPRMPQLAPRLAADKAVTVSSVTPEMIAGDSTADKLQALRHQVAKITAGGAAIQQMHRLSLGLSDIDRHLGGGLPRHALHEVAGSGFDHEQAIEPAFFALHLMHCQMQHHPAGGACLWISPHRDLYGPGLQHRGIDPARLIMVTPRNDQETLWAMEEALRSDGIALVVGEIDLLDLTASRRLQLAAEGHGRMAIALRRWRKGETAQKQQQAPIAAATRWLIRALPGWRPAPIQGKRRPDLGAPCWRLDLWRQRNGPAGSWDIIMQDRELRHVDHASRAGFPHGSSSGQALSLPVAAALGYRSLAAAADSRQDDLAATG